MSFFDVDGQPVDVPPPDARAYDPIGRWQGGRYGRNAFTRGTAAEVDELWTRLRLAPGDEVLDVGCGDGRHSAALAARGVVAIGVDRSLEVLTGGEHEHRRHHRVCADGAALPLARNAVAAALSLCQGAFGCEPALDRRVLSELQRVVRPGGRLALTAYSLAFAARYATQGDALDLVAGVHHHRPAVRGEDGADRRFDLWTTAYSPAHLLELVRSHGFRPESVSGCEPGRYGAAPPTVQDPELLVVATREVLDVE